MLKFMQNYSLSQPIFIGTYLIFKISSTPFFSHSLALRIIGLNAAKICENALKLAISRLQGININKYLVDEAGFEPATSTMPTWRSCQTDLLAQSTWLLHFNSPRLISVSYEGFRLLIGVSNLGRCYLLGR